MLGREWKQKHMDKQDRARDRNMRRRGNRKEWEKEMCYGKERESVDETKKEIRKKKRTTGEKVVLVSEQFLPIADVGVSGLHSHTCLCEVKTPSFSSSA